MIENILIVDVETTGLDVNNHKLIELGAILYNVKHKVMLQCMSTLFHCEENPVEHINGIKAEYTQIEVYSMESLRLFNLMALKSDRFVAHNASFDRRFICKKVSEMTPSFYQTVDYDKNWICTKNDFKWPVELPRKRLQDVCEAMGVPYVNAHRALTDCNLIVDCFNKVTDLQERINGLLHSTERERPEPIVSREI